MKQQNPNREPSSKPNVILELFQHKKLILGEIHVAAEKKGPSPCGPNCPHRLTSITCPFFTPTTPCLVGCEVKQVIEAPGSNGQTFHREISIFVTSQAGMILVGEENLINLTNQWAHTRIVKNKHGQEVSASESYGESLFEIEAGARIISNGELLDDPEVNENAKS